MINSPRPSKIALLCIVAIPACEAAGVQRIERERGVPPKNSRGLAWPELMQRVFAIDVLLCPSCGGRMTAIAEITDKRVARKMLEHVGVPSDAPEQWPARGPPELVGSSWFDEDQRGPHDDAEPATQVE